jgi:hypothetical protein
MLADAGSVRIPPTHPHFALSRELSKELGLLLKVPAWSGIGYGLMDAVCQGAAEAGVPAAGFKILREGGKWVGAVSPLAAKRCATLQF